MNKLSTLLILVILGFLLLIFFNKPSGTDQLLERQKFKADSASKEAEKWRQKAAEYFQAYSTSETNAKKLELRFNYMREENEKLKRRPVVRYSNQQLDSVFAKYDR